MMLKHAVSVLFLGSMGGQLDVLPAAMALVIRMDRRTMRFSASDGVVSQAAQGADVGAPEDSEITKFEMTGYKTFPDDPDLEVKLQHEHKVWDENLRLHEEWKREMQTEIDNQEAFLKKCDEANEAFLKNSALDIIDLKIKHLKLKLESDLILKHQLPRVVAYLMVKNEWIAALSKTGSLLMASYDEQEKEQYQAALKRARAKFDEVKAPLRKAIKNGLKMRPSHRDWLLARNIQLKKEMKETWGKLCRKRLRQVVLRAKELRVL